MDTTQETERLEISDAIIEELIELIEEGSTIAFTGMKQWLVRSETVTVPLSSPKYPAMFPSGLNEISVAVAPIPMNTVWARNRSNYCRRHSTRSVEPIVFRFERYDESCSTEPPPGSRVNH